MLWLCAGYLYLNFQDGRRLSESQSDHLARSGELDDWVCKRRNLLAGQLELSYNIFVRGKRREFRIILAKQEGNESEA